MIHKDRRKKGNLVG